MQTSALKDSEPSFSTHLTQLSLLLSFDDDTHISTSEAAPVGCQRLRAGPQKKESKQAHDKQVVASVVHMPMRSSTASRAFNKRSGATPSSSRAFKRRVMVSHGLRACAARAPPPGPSLVIEEETGASTNNRKVKLPPIEHFKIQ